MGSKQLFTPKKRETAVVTVINTIKDLILKKEILPGDKLPSETELSEQLGFSRGSIREAMKILSAFGVIQIRRGDGTYVANQITDSMINPLIFSLILTEANTKELVELRELMEFEVARLIIKNAKDEDLECIHKAFIKMKDLTEKGNEDMDLLVQCELEFHKAMGLATRNQLVEKIYDFVLEFFAPYIRKTFENKEKGWNALRLHQQIIEALMAKDLEKTLKAIKESIEAWQQLGRF